MLMKKNLQYLLQKKWCKKLCAYTFFEPHFPSSSGESCCHFRCSVLAVDPCHGDLVARDGGTLVSPGFPFGYAKSLDCKWTIAAPPSHRVWFNLTSVGLEGTGWCMYDWIDVYSGQSCLCLSLSCLVSSGARWLSGRMPDSQS